MRYMAFRRRFTEFKERFGAPAADLPLVVDQDDEVARPFLIVGLGNPGAQYGNTRHNVGAWCINRLARQHGTELTQQGRVERARIEVAGHTVDIARPRAFMNESGPPIAAELKRLGLRPEHLLVIYDDLDLPVGRTRMRLRGSSGGNRGMRSLIAALGSEEFARVRIGIDRPYDGTSPVRDPDRIAKWVLSVPAPDDRARLDAAVVRTVEAVELAIREGLEPAMNWLHRQPDDAEVSSERGDGQADSEPPESTVH